MANTSPVYSRMDTALKNNAEGILAQLGITPSSAIQMFYSQIILHRGLPFEARLPENVPTAIGNMTRAELDAQLMQGFQSLQNGMGLSEAEVDAELEKEFNL